MKRAPVSRSTSASDDSELRNSRAHRAVARGRSGFPYIDAMHVAMALSPERSVAHCIGDGGGVIARRLVKNRRAGRSRRIVTRRERRAGSSLTIQSTATTPGRSSSERPTVGSALGGLPASRGLLYGREAVARVQRRRAPPRPRVVTVAATGRKEPHAGHSVDQQSSAHAEVTAMSTPGLLRAGGRRRPRRSYRYRFNVRARRVCAARLSSQTPCSRGHVGRRRATSNTGDVCDSSSLALRVPSNFRRRKSIRLAT